MISVFKLINGENIISEVVDPSELILKNPASIIIQQTEHGMGVGLAPFMPYAKGNITLYHSAIAAKSVPDVELENEYSRIFGSGLVIAQAGSIK